jgi:hypothetical protein
MAPDFAEPVIGRRFAPTRWLHPGYDCLLLYFAAGLDPILEAAEIVDCLVAHFLEQFAGQGSTAARGAVQDDGLVEGERLLGGRRRQVGLEFERAARDVHGARGLAGRGQLGAVANVDQLGVAFADHRDGVRAGDLRHNGIGGIDEGFGGGGHGGSERWEEGEAVWVKRCSNALDRI